MLSKRRTTIPLEDLSRLSRAELDARWAGYWFEQRLTARRVEPVCQVAYHRHARVTSSPYGTVRLTFDNEIAAQPCYGPQFDPPAGVPVLETRAIVEMKYRAVLPAVLRHLVEEFALEPTSVSKYRLSLEALQRAGLPTGAARINLNDVLHAPPPARQVNA